MTTRSDPRSNQRPNPIDQIRESYGAIARTGQWAAGFGVSDAPAEADAKAGGCCAGDGAAGGGCCGPANWTPEQLAAAIGYAQGELAQMPEGSNLGLSCGNPTALASLRAGETLLDLGSGAGFDCFIAGPKVGASGRVIGVDMTADMLSKARRNIADYTKQTGLSNVEFRLGEIENIPAADASVDVVISNCVFNLSVDKARVWREVARVLRPGGRVAISDLALLRPLPESVRADVEALVGCVAGAVLVEQVLADARAAGLVDVRAQVKPEYVRTLVDAKDPLYVRIQEKLEPGTSVADYVTSMDCTARKPG